MQLHTFGELPAPFKTAVLDYQFLHSRRHSVLHYRTDVRRIGEGTKYRAWMRHGGVVSTVSCSVNRDGDVSAVETHSSADSERSAARDVFYWGRTASGPPLS